MAKDATDVIRKSAIAIMAHFKEISDEVIEARVAGCINRRDGVGEQMWREIKEALGEARLAEQGVCFEKLMNSGTHAMPLKALFFDIDGTLVDSNEFHVMAWDEAFKEKDLLVCSEIVRTQIGKGADQLIPFLFPKLTRVDRDAIEKRHSEIFGQRYLKQVCPFAHATDLVELLYARGKEIILASSADESEVAYYTKLLNLTGSIKGVVTSDDVENSKPAGDIFAAALAQVSPTSAAETLAIGDTPYDVESAMKSQVRTIALRSGGFSDDSLKKAGAAHIYRSVTDLFENFETTPLAM